MTTTHFHGIPTTPTHGAEREHLGEWVGEIKIDGDRFTVRPDGHGGALFSASGCLQIDRYDDGTRAYNCDAAGVVSGVAGRIGQIVGGVYIERANWTREDLGIEIAGTEAI